MKKTGLIIILFFFILTHLNATHTAQNDTIIYLNIPDRRHSAEAPQEGWCGETSIQMVALYYGQFIPQKTIHELPNPAHPDMYASEIPIALNKIGLYYIQFQNSDSKTVADFIKWIKTQLDQSNPVIVGCKLYPTRFPQWSLDHFMVVVGYTENGLIYNTTWGRQEEKSFERLSSLQERGISFENRFLRYYGLAIKGFK
jgi:hypothetical protein